ncbi:histidinol dehydrogenase [Hellea sp.]|nr:histidinol dehydrogenase [Hellea sp.]MDA8888876.1 histidinol dehydrogenase [Hellea sp.]MDB4844496.1 histidinol dehydrogenase [Hellea sp.]MDC0650456.1 histidinol dehydrogenase [Hellea sp.]MDC1062639.1 histidinol dehydrogenase [Hellea sp.]
MKKFIWKNMDLVERTQALARPYELSDPSKVELVKNILLEVKLKGDDAVKSFTSMYDNVNLVNLRVANEDLENAWLNLPKKEKNAIKVAISNIEKFHISQLPQDIEIETTKGVFCRRETRALQTAGLYVPGGTAPLVSTLLMLAVPAKVAGVRRRIVVSPPGANGKIHSSILAAAYICGVTDVFSCGGAQAIAALSYGTESLPKCDKIFGPGNAYVSLAKSLVAQEIGGPAIDMPAGPSEAMVIADNEANPAFVAADLLSQAEHDVLAQVICVSTTSEISKNIYEEIDKQLEKLPRKDIARQAMKNSRLIIAKSREMIVDIINNYSPEHLILQIKNPDHLVPAIRNAGSIFLGPWSPEAVGDYASGTNHTLPTNGAAKSYSGITIESFLKYISIQKLSKKGLELLAPTVNCLAEMEGLEAHKRSVTIRLDTNNG